MKILSKIIATTGWSPIGKALLIHIDETACQTLVDKTIMGILTDLISNNVATITLNTSIQINGSEVYRIRAYTRHRGFDFYRLPLGFIAADLAIDIDRLKGCASRFSLRCRQHKASVIINTSLRTVDFKTVYR